MTTIHHLIAARADLSPAHPAVEGTTTRLTYRELVDQAREIAARLRAAGANRESIVGLSAPRSPEALAGLLGILFADCAYVYLDPTYPRERRAFMAWDCQLKLALVDSPAGWELPAVTALPLSGHADMVEPFDRVDHDAQLCYVCYTSGSTGEPKGVLVEHRSVAAMAHGLAVRYGIHPGSRALQYASWNYDAAIGDIFTTLAAGATLCLAPDQVRSSGVALANYLRQAHITFAALTPSVLSTMPEHDLPELVSVAAVGEPCTPEVVQRWGGNRRFFNGYGPTETTVAATVADLNPGDDVHLGTPVPGAKVRVVDLGTGHEVASGVNGELQVGGVGVARGYLNRPELTAENFLLEDDQRWYRTGDIVRREPSGIISYVGRLDNQVQVRGHRVELEEIEARLRQHEGVNQCAVTLNNGVLVAHVVPARPDVNAAALLNFLREWLPIHMVPDRVALLEALPLGGWGKVDRGALRQDAHAS
ncbi:MAG: amino acid adenylation domain-containing protein [Corynebacteriales bacterium]|nr:amino acid adenylation domain-containing protein [Mycobacteriales bacterium]